MATSQDGRSQHDNRDKAMKALVARVYDYFQSQQTEAIDSERKSKVGTGDRAETVSYTHLFYLMRNKKY